MICCLVVVDIYEVFIKSVISVFQFKGEFCYWVFWLKWCVEEDNWENMVEVKSFFVDQCYQLFKKLYVEVGDWFEVQVVWRLYENMGEIFVECKIGIDVFVLDGFFMVLYEIGYVIVGLYLQLCNVFDCFGYVNFNMCILEVGVGIGVGI